MAVVRALLVVIGLVLFGIVGVVLVRTVRAMRADDNIYERMWR